jgi:hypothetical protein
MPRWQVQLSPLQPLLQPAPAHCHRRHRRRPPPPPPPWQGPWSCWCVQYGGSSTMATPPTRSCTSRSTCALPHAYAHPRRRRVLTRRVAPRLNPAHVKRAAMLLQSGAVLGKVFQPHEVRMPAQKRGFPTSTHALWAHPVDAHPVHTPVSHRLQSVWHELCRRRGASVPSSIARSVVATPAHGALWWWWWWRCLCVWCGVWGGGGGRGRLWLKGRAQRSHRVMGRLGSRRWGRQCSMRHTRPCQRASGRCRSRRWQGGTAALTWYMQRRCPHGTAGRPAMMVPHARATAR